MIPEYKLNNYVPITDGAAVGVGIQATRSSPTVLVVGENPVFVKALSDLLRSIRGISAFGLVMEPKDDVSKLATVPYKCVDAVVLGPSNSRELDANITDLVRRTWPEARVVVVTKLLDARNAVDTSPRPDGPMVNDTLVSTRVAVQVPRGPCLSLRLLNDMARVSTDTSVKLGLTRRETEVATLVREGRTNREIARLLSISPRTVQRHLANIFRKLHCKNRVQVTGQLLESSFDPDPPFESC